MARLTVPVKLRWSDIDGYGHVNNAAMLTLLEEARIAAFWADPDDDADAAGGRILAAGTGAQTATFIAHQEIEYLAPLEYNGAMTGPLDDLTVLEIASWVAAPSCGALMADMGDGAALARQLAAEMYGEHFDIPAPDQLVFISSFSGGEVFRSGCCFYRGRGKIFYFRPGHETFPTYYQPEVQRVIANGVKWAAPSEGPKVKFGNVPEFMK